MPATELPPHNHAGRRDAARRRLVERDGTHLLVTDPVNVRYLSGFTGSNGQLLLAADPREDRLITDQRYDERAATSCPDLDRILDRDAIGAALSAAPGATLLVEAAHLSWQQGLALTDRGAEVGVRLDDADGLVEALRLIKDDAEVLRLTEACRITEEALAWLFAEVTAPGVSERELAVTLERAFIDAGADGIAFPSIVASGPNAAIPHHEPTTRTLASGDLLTIDCGAEVDGYHADHTRTVAVGHLDAALRRVHDTVRAAQQLGREAVVAGTTAGDVDAVARAVIEDAGYADAFLHGTGHGVGLRIHEAPSVARGSAATLRAGMALTVEPGIYLSGRGGVRIEDTLVVTADAPAHALTDSSRELLVL